MNFSTSCFKLRFNGDKGLYSINKWKEKGYQNTNLFLALLVSTTSKSNLLFTSQDVLLGNHGDSEWEIVDFPPTSLHNGGWKLMECNQDLK